MIPPPVIDIVNPPAGSTPATLEQLYALGLTDADIEAGEQRGQMRTQGMWQIPVSYKAVVESTVFGPNSSRVAVRYWPPRTLVDIKQASGLSLEGRVSLGGKKYSAFTSSELFELPCGKLIDVATIFVRLPAEFKPFRA